jgi:hypothetical protein
MFFCDRSLQHGGVKRSCSVESDRVSPVLQGFLQIIQQASGEANYSYSSSNMA